jgi:ABC-type Na+ efflux pump permease subunit
VRHSLRQRLDALAFASRSQTMQVLRDSSTLMLLGFPMLLYPMLIWAMLQAASYVLDDDETVYTVAFADQTPDAGRRPDLAGAEQLAVEAADLRGLDDGVVDALIALEGRTAKVHHRSGSASSRNALEAVEDALDAWGREAASKAGLEAGGDPVKLDLEAYDFEVERAPGDEPLSLFLIALLACGVVPISVVVGALNPVIELFVSEREKKTLETTLSLAVPRIDLVLARLFAAGVVAAAAAVGNLFALWLTIAHVELVLVDEALATADLPLPGALTLVAVPLVLLAQSALVVTLLAAMMSVAQTYREAQTLGSVVLTALMLPLMGGMLAVIAEQADAYVLVPLVHTGILLNQAVRGTLAWGDLVAGLGVDLVTWAALLGAWCAVFGATKLLWGFQRPAWVEKWFGGNA